MNKDTGGRVIYYIDGDISGFEKAVDKVKDSLDSVNENAEKSLKNISSSFESIVPSFLSITRNIVSNFSSAFDSLVDTATKTSSQIMGTMSNLSQVDFPNLLDSNYLKKSALSGVQINAQIEDAKLGMEKLLGSKAEADRIQAKILKGAADTPFGVGNLTQYVQQLAAVTKNGDKSYDTVMAFGKAIKISGGSLNDMSRMIVNLQQVASSGMSIIDYRQFKRAIPIFDDILKASGLTTESILREAGDSEETIKRKANLLVGALEKYGSSIPWSTFDNNFSQIKDSFEENVSTTFANAMKNSGAFEMLKKGMIDMRESLVAAEPQITKAFKTISTIFANIKWDKVIKSLASTLESLAKTGQKIIPIFTKVLEVLGGGDAGKGLARIITFSAFGKIGKIAQKNVGQTIGVLKSLAEVSKSSFALIGKSFEKIFGMKIKIPGFDKAFSSIKKFEDKTEEISNIGKASKGMSGGIKNLIGIAGSITLLAGAIWLIGQSNLGIEKAVATMGGMIVAIGVMAILSKIIGAKKLNIKNEDILKLVYISGALAAAAGALAIANFALSSIANLGDFSAKLGVMGAVILSLGILAAFIGTSWKNIGKSVDAGLLNILKMTGALTISAIAFRTTYLILPSSNELQEFAIRLGAFGATIAIFGILSGIIGGVQNKWGIINDGLKSVALIVGTLLICSFVFKQIFNNLLPSNEFGEIQARIGSFALAIGEMSALSGAFGKFEKLSEKIINGLIDVNMVVGALLTSSFLMNKAFDNLLPSDKFGEVQAKIGGFALAIVEIGLLGLAVGAAIKYFPIILLGLGGLSLIAGSLLLTSSLFKSIFDNLLPSDKFEEMQKRIGGFALVIGEISLLGGALGIIPLVSGVIILGLGAVAAICGSLYLVSTSLDKTYNNLSAINFDDFSNKIDGFINISNKVIKLDIVKNLLNLAIVPGLLVLNSLFNTISKVSTTISSISQNLLSKEEFTKLEENIESIKTISNTISTIAKDQRFSLLLGSGPALSLELSALASISNVIKIVSINISEAVSAIPNGLAESLTKIELTIDSIKKIKDKILDKNAGLLSIVGNVIDSKIISQELNQYVNISESLAKISMSLKVAIDSIPFDMALEKSYVVEKIKNTLKLLKELKDSFKQSGGIIGEIGKFFYNENSMSGIDSIITLVERLKKLGDNLMILKDVSVGKLNIVLSNGVLDTLKKTMEQLKEKFADVNKSVEEVKTSVNDQNNSDNLTFAIKVAENLKNLVDNFGAISEVNTFKLEDSIKNKIPALKTLVEQLAKEFVVDGDSLAKKIENFFNSSSKEITGSLDKSVEIAKKLGELIDSFGKIAELDVSKMNSAVAENGTVSKLKNIIVILKKTFIDDADSIKNEIQNFDTSYIDKVKDVMSSITVMGENVAKVGEFNIDINKTTTFISNMRTVIDKVIENFGTNSPTFTLKQETVDGIKNVEEVSASISELSKHVNAIQEINIEAADKKIDACKTVIEKIVSIFSIGNPGSINLASLINNEVESNVQSVSNIFASLSGMAKIANEFQAFNQQNIINKLDSIKIVIDKIKATFFGADGNDNSLIEALNKMSTMNLGIMTTAIGDLKNMANIVKDFPDVKQGAERLKIFTQSLVESILSLASKMKEGGNIEILKNVGRDIAIHVLEGLNEKINSEGIAKGTEVANKLKEQFETLAQTYQDIGKNIGDKIFEGFINQTQNKAGEIVGIISEKITWPFHNTYQKTYNDAGSAIVAGIEWGLNSSTWRINNAMTNISQAAVERLKTLLGIHSPSKVFYSLGQYMGEGLVDGLESMTKSVSEKTKELVNTANIGLNSVRGGNIDFSRNSSYGTTNKTNNVYMTNNISNNMDLSAVMGQLKWNIDRA